MSKTADKAANRSAIKSNWNNAAFTQIAKPKAPPSSWWVDGAAPGRDAKFTELARARDAEASWSNVVPTAMNPRGNFV